MNGFDERNTGSHQKLVKLVGKNKRVLEMGCGKGFVSQRLKQNGCIITAIEIDKKNAEAAKRFCEKVFIGNIETMKPNFKPKSFDVITFGDVLEHLYNPANVLQQVKPFLKDDGLLIVSIPNIANWKARLKLLFGKFDYEAQGIMDKTHLRFFTRKTARNLLEETGFKIVKSDFVPSFPFPFFKKYLAKINPSLFAFQFIFAAKKK